MQLVSTKTKQQGFSLLETVLAIIVIMVAGMGVYALFESGANNNDMSDATNEMVQVASVYSNLASLGLTNDLSTEADLVALLQNSGQLSSSYFANTTDADDATTAKLVNKFGTLVFDASNITPYGFVVDVPLNPAGNPVSQFCQQLNDVYQQCVATATGEEDGDATGNSATLTLDLSS